MAACGSATCGQLQATAPGGVPGEPASNDLVGQAAAIAADTLVVGAFSDEIERCPGQGELGHAGSLCILHFDGQVWQVEQRLIAPDLQSGAFFGWHVVIFGNTLIVGARPHDAPPAGVGNRFAP